ncbi:helix-turn-helix domain-containing protein [Paenibacillus sp. YN15]|uniref:response regulator transcription factor n=1 Tax=Paenibacillus sp. YN15 TaxID=1742774 RepID=UPI000DCB3F47|nr:helix-turn-helix domain-containing protein [Paenibacillus sp. YN15]RAV05085.1 DNA-binding response regulator [Paenibacillus sp. YN15]
MYKVMLVDDDYPVLELLSEAIPWDRLGVELMGVYENGAVALEAAQTVMPDIVVTDIGMPRLNGLELIRALKELNPAIRVVILSCHSEFHYAQQAMKLNVQDYLVKDTLDPQDLETLLGQMKASLDEETSRFMKNDQLRQLVDRNREQHKEAFIRGTVHTPLLNELSWINEAEAFGLATGGSFLPVICYIDGQRSARQRFVTDDVLRFAVNNLLEEMLAEVKTNIVNFTYDALRSFIIAPVVGGIKTNPYDLAEALFRRIQAASAGTIKVGLSFIIGTMCKTPQELKQELNGLLGSSGQRFYMYSNSLERKNKQVFSSADLFASYDEAANEFREILIEGKADQVQPVIRRWMQFIREERFRPDTVKDWAMKLMLDLKLKLQSMQMFRNHFSVEILHRELLEIDTLEEMELWMIHFFESSLVVAGEVKELSKRTEVLDACQYVTLNLNRRITLDEVAEHLFMNPSYFSRLFRKETGETFIEYVNRMKVERAKELLDQTSLSVAKIGETLGYDNHSYFIKMFRSVAGTTPQEYRNGNS